MKRCKHRFSAAQLCSLASADVYCSRHARGSPVRKVANDKTDFTWPGFMGFLRGELTVQAVVVVMQVLFVLYTGVSGAARAHPMGCLRILGLWVRAFRVLPKPLVAWPNRRGEGPSP